MSELQVASSPLKGALSREASAKTGEHSAPDSTHNFEKLLRISVSTQADKKPLITWIVNAIPIRKKELKSMSTLGVFFFYVGK